MDELDKASLVAFHRAKSTIEEYEGYLRERETNKKSPKQGRR